MSIDDDWVTVEGVRYVPEAPLKTEIARLREIAEIAKQVRDAQRQYFKTRDRLDLIASKQVERRLDDALAKEGK